MSTNEGESLIDQLSPLDHLSPRIHVPKLLYFSSEEHPNLILSTLQDALAKAIAAFPILGGTVALLKEAKQTGTLAVQSPFFSAKDILSVADLSSKYSYAEIRERSFCPDAVDEQLVSPDTAANSSRVMLAQANIIEGGLLLVVACHHCVFDENGIFNVIKLWSSYCQGDKGLHCVTPGWTDRTALMVGRGTGRLEDHPEYQLRPSENSATHSSAGSTYISQLPDTNDRSNSAIFFFSDESLVRLKHDASQQEKSWISTNDALCALIWSAVTRARNDICLGDATYSMFNMTVNGRNRLDPPMSAEYTGNAVFISKAFLSLPDLLSESRDISHIAKAIRDSVAAIDDTVINDKIKAVSEVDDIGRLCPGTYNSHKRHLGCTSWSKQPYYSLEWGSALGGKCRRIRWRRNISDGIFVIFPRVPEGEVEKMDGGGLEVYLGLQHDALGVLCNDAIFKSYAEIRCS